MRDHGPFGLFVPSKLLFTMLNTKKFCSVLLLYLLILLIAAVLRLHVFVDSLTLLVLAMDMARPCVVRAQISTCYCVTMTHGAMFSLTLARQVGMTNMEWFHATPNSHCTPPPQNHVRGEVCWTKQEELSPNNKYYLQGIIYLSEILYTRLRARWESLAGTTDDSGKLFAWFL